MEQISSLIKIPTKTRTTERGEMMKWFMDFLNPERVRAKYTKLSYARIGKMLEAVPTKDLYALQSQMKQRSTEAAAKYFYWSLREEKTNL